MGIVTDHQLTGTWIPLGVHYAPYTLCLGYNAVVRRMAANLHDASLDIGPVGRFFVYIMAGGVPVVIYYNGMISSAADYVLHNFLHLIVQHFVLNHTAKVGPFCTLRKRNTL